MTRFAIETWQFFNEYRKAFGKVNMRKIFGIESYTTIYKWCADPETNGETRPNPLDRLETMLKNLANAGEEETAQAIVDRMAMIVGCQLVCKDGIKADKKTIAEECLDDLPAIAKYHQSMINGDDIITVRRHHRTALRELDENMALYISQNRNSTS